MFIKVKVTADAKKFSLQELSPERYAIKVTEPAANNRANREVVRIFQKLYKVKEGKIYIVSGHRKPSKILSVETTS